MKNKNNGCYCHTHALNNSISKTTHAFNKADRFPKTFQSPCKRASYDLSQSAAYLSKSAMIDHSTKFGSQRRFVTLQTELKRHSLLPSPGTYESHEQFNIPKNNKKSGTIGRQEKLKLKSNQVPGPGKYQINKCNPQASLSYTMRSRVSKGNTHWNLAGPGQYNLKSSFSAMSTYNQGPSVKIGKDKRFQMRDNEVPSPNTYYNGKLMTEPTSTFESTSKYSFGRASKGLKIKTEGPGPGAYHQFSEFQACNCESSRY